MTVDRTIRGLYGARALTSVLATVALLMAGCGSDDSKKDSSTSGSGTTQATTDGGAATEPVAKAEVKIASFKFLPQTVTVQAGGTVTFTNFDAAPHTATADDKTFDTDRLDQKHKSATETFKTPGTYTYYCVYHRFMTGTVVVK